MTAAERLAVQVTDAIERTPTESVPEVVSAFVAIVSVTTELAYVRLRDLGLSDRMAAGILGIQPASMIPLPLLD
jgi:hypothetical protein